LLIFNYPLSIKKNPSAEGKIRQQKEKLFRKALET